MLSQMPQNVLPYLPPLPREVAITLGPVGDGSIYYQAMQHLALAFDAAHQLVLLPASLVFTDSCGHSCCYRAGSQHLHLAPPSLPGHTRMPGHIQTVQRPGHLREDTHGSLNEKGTPQAHAFKDLVPSW